MEQFVIDFESIEWTEPAPGIRFKAIVQDGRQLRLVEFAQNFVESDWCKKGHIGYVIEGELEINFNGARKRVKSGDGLIIPAGEKAKHKAKVVGKVAKVILLEDV
jgi:quercetin dioxygenase-like cupin family protein